MDLVPHLGRFLAHEEQHREVFRIALAERGVLRCFSYPLCALGGWVLGVLTALCGRSAIGATTVAVERVVLRHLDAQLMRFAREDGHAYAAVASIVNDERPHRDAPQESSRMNLAAHSRRRTAAVAACVFAAVALLAPLRAAWATEPASTPAATESPPVAAPAVATPSPTADPYAPGKEIVADIGRIVAPRGVQETFEVVLGGARQVVNVRGVDRTQPLLLFVHGGPAAPEMPIAWTFQRAWEDYFTVVQWDQRGSGRSYPLNDPAALAPTLAPDRYRDDAIELIEQLLRRYGQHKVVLVGHSWGSVVGLSVALHRPDLLHAYVGIGQVVDFRENERLGWEWTLARAREDGNAEAVRELEALAPYPGPGAFDVQRIATERKWSVYYGALAAHRRDAEFYFHAGRLSPEYTPDDRRAWDAGSEFSMRVLFPQLADLSFAGVRELKVPVVFFLGRYDYTTPSPLAAEWLARVRAPRKVAVWFEHSAHLPMLEEPGRAFAALLEHVVPLTRR